MYMFIRRNISLLIVISLVGLSIFCALSMVSVDGHNHDGHLYTTEHQEMISSLGLAVFYITVIVLAIFFLFGLKTDFVPNLVFLYVKKDSFNHQKYRFRNRLRLFTLSPPKDWF